MNVLSLFAGIGGLELGLERAGMTTVGQVELDPFCRQVLAKHWPEVPRHDDVRTAVEWWESEPRPPVDVICGGFPCQDISNAGRRAGIGGERSGLWTHMARTVRVLRPRYVVMENVSALLVRGLDIVAGDLAEIGYDLQWDCIPAAAVGAPHRRDRWWAVAYPDSERPGGRRLSAGQRPGLRDASGRSGRDEALAGGSSVDVDRGTQKVASKPSVADSDRTGLEVGNRRTDQARPFPAPVVSRWWAAEPDVGRVAHGISRRVDRLRSLGNAVVPQVAEHIGRLVMEFDAQRQAAA